MNKFVFFGSAEFSVKVLNELKIKGVSPSLIITTKDKPKGRKLVLTPNVVKVWAEQNDVPVDVAINRDILKEGNYDFFLVVAYGKILKKEIFDIPQFKTLNVHPSLLPRYRGASPMISQILNDEKEMGTSIMLIDEGMDTGPVLARIPLSGLRYAPSRLSPNLGESENQIPNIQELEETMARESVSLFLETIPKYLSSEIKPIPQNEAEASYSQKIKKEDGLINLEEDPRKNLLKIKAFSVWPRAYFFLNEKRIVVTDATLDEQGNLKLLKVIPEGKNEMSYDDFLRGLKM